MKSKLRRFLVLALSIELLVSSIGVAQVSHLCKMAIAGVETVSCHGSGNETHPCCDSGSAGGGEQSKRESCCSDQVRYFNNKVNGTLQYLFKLLPVDIFVILLPYSLISTPEFSYVQGIFQIAEFPPGTNTQPVFISIQSLLI